MSYPKLVQMLSEVALQLVACDTIREIMYFCVPLCCLNRFCFVSLDNLTISPSRIKHMIIAARKNQVHIKTKTAT